MLKSNHVTKPAARHVHRVRLDSSPISPLIFAFFRDCPYYLASAKTVRVLLFLAETVLHDEWLLAKSSACFCFLSRVSAGSSITLTVQTGSHFSRAVSAEAKNDGRSRQAAKISGLVYTCENDKSFSHLLTRRMPTVI